MEVSCEICMQQKVFLSFLCTKATRTTSAIFEPYVLLLSRLNENDKTTTATKISKTKQVNQPGHTTIALYSSQRETQRES